MSLHIHRFFTVYEPEYDIVEITLPTGDTVNKAKQTGRQREVHMVTYGPLGQDKLIMTEKVARLQATQPMAEAQRNPAILMAHARWNEIAPYYENWIKGNAITADGTPLAAWNGVGPEQAEALKLRGITTVEQLGSLNDLHFEKFGIPGLRTIAENAKRFLSTLDQTLLADRLAEKDLEIEALREQLTELADFVNQLRRGELSLPGEGGLSDQTVNTDVVIGETDIPAPPKRAARR